MLRVRQATLQMSTASNSPLRQRLSDGFQELAFPCDAGDRLLSRRCPLFNGQGRGMARASHVRGGTYEAETKQSGRRGPLEPQGAASISHSFWEDTQVEICHVSAADEERVQRPVAGAAVELWLVREIVNYDENFVQFFEA